LGTKTVRVDGVKTARTESRGDNYSERRHSFRPLIRLVLESEWNEQKIYVNMKVFDLKDLRELYEILQKAGIEVK